MARPIEEGLDYFPLDVNTDEKLDLIEAEFGLNGFAVIIKLYQWIYARGYYCKWTEEVALLFARKRCGVGGNVVSEIIAAAIKRDIFNKVLYEKYQILTSRGLQKRYFEAIARRVKINVIKQYLLVSVADFKDNVSKNWVLVDINGANVNRNKQRKVKESKGEESREKNIGILAEPEWREFVQMRKSIKSPLTDGAIKRSLNKLEELAPKDIAKQKQILAQSCDNTWKGLFPLKGEDNARGTRDNPKTVGTVGAEDRTIYGTVL